MVINALSSGVDRMSPGKPSEIQGARDDLNVHPQSLQLKVATKGMSSSSHHCLHIYRNDHDHASDGCCIMLSWRGRILLRLAGI